MRIVNEHDHLVQRNIDALEVLAEHAPDELGSLGPEHLAHLQRVTRYMRGDSPELVAEAVSNARHAFGRPDPFPASIDYDTVNTMELIFDELLEAALMILQAEYEQDVSGEWLPRGGKLSDKRDRALRAAAFLHSTDEYLFDCVRDSGPEGYVDR